MRYLRMLSNSLAAAALTAAYVLVLILQLNPTLSRSTPDLLPLATTAGVYYVIHLTVVFYVLLVICQILARELFSPAWISVGVLAWLGAMASAAGALLMWRNLSTFALVLDDASTTSLAWSALALGASTPMFLLVAIYRRKAPHLRVVWASLLLVVVAASVAAPLAIRGRGTPAILEARPMDVTFDVIPVERTSRVAIVAIDGGSLDFITNAAAEGRLPNFGKILDGGAVRHLATLHPTSAEAVWAAVATGKLPQKNGVHSAGTYRLAHGSGQPLQLLPEYCFANGLVRLGFVREEPHSSATFRTRTIWSILSTHGFSVGVVGWPLTQPTPAVRGYIVADTFHKASSTASDLVQPSTVYPPELQREAMAAVDATAETPPVVPALNSTPANRIPGSETPAENDRIYERIADALRTTRPVQVTVTRYQSLDPIGHYYLRYATPSEFGDVTDEERRALGGVLERHYAAIDDAIGRAIAAVGPDDLLLVVSGFGMAPLTLGKRLVERVIGDRDLNGTHDTAPDGFLMAYGGSVERGRLTRASVVDVVPTLLYFLGLPIGRDMDGYARTDLFKRSFSEERPITYIPTYDR